MLLDKKVVRAGGLWMKRFLRAQCLMVFAQAAAAQCIPPTHKIFRYAIGPQGGAENVSLAPADVSLATLTCLAQTLNNDHPDWTNVIVFIFSSDRDADAFSATSVAARSEVAQRVRAIYQVASGKRSLTVTPIGVSDAYFVQAPGKGILGEEVYDTKIMLPLLGGPRCRLTLRDRCVLALERFAYPADALAARVSGTVTVRGTVSRDGKVTTTVAGPSRGRNVPDHRLTRSALENLSTWWLESAPRRDGFQITFVYEIDPGLSPGQLDVRVKLPETVEIRASPVK